MLTDFFVVFLSCMGFAFLMLFVGLWHHDQIVAERRSQEEYKDHRNVRRLREPR